jgi:hypothetical protein
MIDFDTSDIMSDERLKELGHSSDEIVRYGVQVMRYNELVKKLAKANEAKHWDSVVEYEAQLDPVCKYLKYAGRHPKTIPVKELQDLAPGVKNPATAIRMFCRKCMGGDDRLVRECEAVSCPIWAFRTGKNPFFGKTLPPVQVTAQLDDGEPDEAEDETDNQDAD